MPNFHIFVENESVYVNFGMPKFVKTLYKKRSNRSFNGIFEALTPTCGRTKNTSTVKPNHRHIMLNSG